MMKLCSSVPDIKLTRGRQNSISGWVNPYQRRIRGKRVAKPGNKKYNNGLFGSNRKSGYISFDHWLKRHLNGG